MPRLHLFFSLILVLSLMLATSRTQAFDERTGRGILLVANKGDRSVSIVDPESGRQIATVAEGGTTGHELVASPDGGTAYVPIYGDSGVGKPGSDGRNIVVIDIGARKVIGNVDFGHGVRPHCAVFGPKDGMLYVTTELNDSVSVIDPHTLKIVGSIPTGQPEAHMLAIARDGRRGYTANVGPGTVSVLDLEKRKMVKVIPVAGEIQRISLSVDDRSVFTSDQMKPRLAVIDTGTFRVKTWIPLEAPGYGTGSTPDGRWLVVAMPRANKVAVVDLGTMKVTHTIDVPGAPQEILVRPDGLVAYVSCDASQEIAVIHVSDWTVEKLIHVGKGADGLAWAAPK
jgi:YVTN family beta-propeller protein